MVVFIIVRQLTQPDLMGDEEKISKRDQENLTIRFRIISNLLLQIAFTAGYLMSRKWLFVTELLAPLLGLIFVLTTVIGLFAVGDDVNKPHVTDTFLILFILYQMIGFRSDYLTSMWRPITSITCFVFSRFANFKENPDLQFLNL